MSSAGFTKDFPLLLSDAVAVANSQRLYQRQTLAVAQCMGQLVSNALPPHSNAVPGRIAPQQNRLWIWAHIACRAHTFGKQPAFIIEAAGIHVAMHPLQLNGKRPVLTRLDFTVRVIPVQS